jgi:uncharacterized protein (TIGR02246 family)
MVDDEHEIRRIIDAQVDGWNRGDAPGFAEGCRSDVGFTNILGMRWDTRDGFVARHAEMFRGVFAGSRLVVTVERLSFPATGIALAELATTLTGARHTLLGMPPSPDGVLRTRMLEVFVTSNGAWEIVACHNTAVQPAGSPRGAG